MNPDNAVLIVVDMQNGFVSPKSEHIVPRVADLTSRWRALGRPYVMTRFINHPGSMFERLIGWSRLEESPEIDLHHAVEEFQADAVAVIDKPGYSFFTPEGIALVDEHGWTDLVIVGIATESCVLKTATDAFERGLVPWVVKDATYSHAGEEAHAAGILVTGRFVGRNQLITSDDALADDFLIAPPAAS